jgi:hypothetical protein
MPTAKAAAPIAVAIARDVQAAAAPDPLAQKTEMPPEAPPKNLADVAIVKIDRARASSTSVKVLVTPCAAEGKSAEAAIALGRNLARRGRTLLVAADPGPAIYDRLTDAPTASVKGFADLLAGA